MQVLSCKIVKEIWDQLCITYEGTKDVKKSRMNMLLYYCELFQNLPHESIYNFYTLFKMIITTLHALGKELSNSKKVCKTMLFFPQCLDTNVLMISELENLSTYLINNLLSSLISQK